MWKSNISSSEGYALAHVAHMGYLWYPWRCYGHVSCCSIQLVCKFLWKTETFTVWPIDRYLSLNMNSVCMCVSWLRQCPQKPRGFSFSMPVKSLRHQLIASTAVVASRVQCYSRLFFLHTPRHNKYRPLAHRLSAFSQSFLFSVSLLSSNKFKSFAFDIELLFAVLNRYLHILKNNPISTRFNLIYLIQSLFPTYLLKALISV